MVIAWALAGDVNRDITQEALGLDLQGQAVYLEDLWPSSAEIRTALAQAIDPADIAIAYEAAEASEAWKTLDAPASVVFPWDEKSTYIRRPPFASARMPSRLGDYTATPLLVVGDDITTDHISPVGQIPVKSDAGRYLIEHGDDPNDLNVYASRRANWEAMVRGLFTNRSVVNLLDGSLPPGQTIHEPSSERMSLFDASRRYDQEGVSLVIVAGERYGMGSSRDWAAKGAGLLSARAILAVSFERIHRSNLVGMGVLPIKLPPGITPQSLALSVSDRIGIAAPAESLKPRMPIPVRIVRQDGNRFEFTATAAVETSLEVDTLKAGGIIPLILQGVMNSI